MSVTNVIFIKENKFFIITKINKNYIILQTCYPYHIATNPQTEFKAIVILMKNPDEPKSLKF